MANNYRLFDGVSHVKNYKKYRPIYPKKLVNRIIEFLKEKKSEPFQLAIDCGCGSGQATNLIAPYFKKVKGFDISEAQISEARNSTTLENVEYGISSGDEIPVKDDSAELIISATAVHWFDIPKFFKETNRVLQKNGCLALFAYSFPTLEYPGGANSELLNKEFFQFSRVDLADYWSERRALVDNKYTDITLPYEDSIRDESFEIRNDLSLADFIGYLSSWSAYNSYREKNPDDPILEKLEKKFLEIMEVTTPADKMPLTRVHKIFLLMGRKS